MELHWQDVQRTDVADQVTDFRLTRQAALYPEPLETLWWSVAIELRNTSIDAFERDVQAEYGQDLLIPSDYDATDRAAVLEDQSVTIYARTPLVIAINANWKKLGIASVHVGSITPKDHLCFGPNVIDKPEIEIEVPEETVVMAIIDDGIAFANNLFRSEALVSRVEFANILASRPKTGGGVSVGRMLTRKQIDCLLKSCTTCGLLDEDLFYREAGVIDYADGTFSPTSLRRSHGTHVMALAAGYPMGHAPKTRPIICAALPSRVTEDVTGQNLLPSLLLALKRLRRQASLFRIRKTRQCPPVVCNFSYGNFDGPHDGTDKIERLIESYCVGALTPPVHGSPKQDVRVLLPAGNGNLARIHAELNDKTRSRDDKWTLDLMVLPDDRTVSTVQMWMPYNASQGVVRARISAPGGAKSGWVRASKGNYQSLQNGAGHEIARLSYTVPHMPTCRGLFTLSINPTFSLEPHVLAPAGRWTIEVEVTERQKWRPDDVIQVWIARDETLPGFKPGGRQAHFDNADYQRFDRIGAPLAHDPADSRSPVRRAGTLSGFACDESPLVIAALTQSNGRLSDYSSAGPICPKRDAPVPVRTGPDAAAKGDDSPVLRGVLSAGSRSGSFVRMNGTSVAAPRVARFAADGIASGAAGDRQWIWNQAEIQDPNFPPPKPPETRTGGGRLDIDVRLGPIRRRLPFRDGAGGSRSNGVNGNSRRG